MKRNLFVIYAGKDLHNLTITYTSNGIVDKFDGKRRRYKVTFKTDFGKVTTTFYDSINNFHNGKTKLTLDDLLYSLSLFLDDCFSYIIGEYGFIEGMTIREMASIKRECRREYLGLVKIAGSNEDTFGDFINAINKTIFNIK